MHRVKLDLDPYATDNDMFQLDQTRKDMFPVKDLVDIVDKLGVIQTVKSKLVNEPDPAANNLLAALEEISKIYLVFETELVNYLSLTLEPDEISEERKVLISLEGGQVAARMGAARGHCGRIDNIYKRYLSAWFERVLAAEEQKKVENLFANLSLTDSIMLSAIDEVSAWLANEAMETNNFVQVGDFKSAQQKVRKARVEVLPARQAISGAIRRIREIEGVIIGASGAV